MFCVCPVQVWQTSESVVNACSQLDWKRCVAVHLWFMLPPTASVADALAEYQDAFQVSHAAALQAKGRLPARQDPKTSPSQLHGGGDCPRHHIKTNNNKKNVVSISNENG